MEATFENKEEGTGIGLAIKMPIKDAQVPLCSAWVRFPALDPNCSLALLAFGE